MLVARPTYWPQSILAGSMLALAVSSLMGWADGLPPRVVVAVAFLLCAALLVVGLVGAPRVPTADASADAEGRIAELEVVMGTTRRERDEAAASTARGEVALAQLQAGVTPSIGRLFDSSTTLKDTADTISRAALRITSETTSASVAAHDANHRVETVARSGQDFVEMITRIGDLATRSSQMGFDAVGKAETTTVAIDEMTAASEQIGALTTLIGGIANQTNLLALNATIEAARAGEQGRGFAVVAGEVKSLANETAKAVGTIADMVATIRASTERSVGAVRSIAGQVRALNEANADIAQAVQDRIRAASEMAGSVDQAAANVHFVMQAISTIEAAADEAVQGAGFLRTTAVDIGEESASLKAALDAADTRVVALGPAVVGTASSAAPPTQPSPTVVPAPFTMRA